MFVIAKPQTKNTLVTSSYVPCARNITSGNLFANMGHMLVIAEAPAEVDAAIVADAKTESTKCYESSMKFGEVVSLTGGASDSRTVDVIGEDYLGNPMKETFTLNNATAVSGKKAFKKIFKVVASAAGAVKMSTTGKIGMPYQTSALIKVTKNGVVDNTAALTAFAQTQSATSADPRGIVSLAHCSTGDEVEIIFSVTEYCTKSNGVDVEGGLFGVKPFAG